MSLTLEQIVARLEDQDTPVVWLDPTTSPDIWLRLPGALRDQGYFVMNLDDGGRVFDYHSLLDHFSIAADLPANFDRTLPSLKDCLLALPNTTRKGWVVIFRNPDELRQNDEAVFEEFLEVLESVHDSMFEVHQRVFKLVVQD